MSSIRPLRLLIRGTYFGHLDVNRGHPGPLFFPSSGFLATLKDPHPPRYLIRLRKKPGEGDPHCNLAHAPFMCAWV